MQMDVTVNSASLVPPALQGAAVDRHGKFHGIFSGGKFGDIIDDPGVSGEVFPGFYAIDQQFASAENAVKFQKDLLTVKEPGDFQMFAVNGTAGGQKTVVTVFQMAFQKDGRDVARSS